MRITRHMSFVVAMILSATSLRAQSAPDISGHWEGKFGGPMEGRFEADFAKTSAGGYIGTLGIPAEHISGIPVTKVAVDGRAIHFRAREDQPFNGYLTDDGKEMTGELSVEGFTIPVLMTKTGEAKIEPRPKSAAVSKELAGTWNATFNGLRVVLTIENQADGTSSGRLVNRDEGNLEIPLQAITQAASIVTLDLKAVEGSYSGTLNADGTELVGSYSEKGKSAPLTFTRADRNK